MNYITATYRAKQNIVTFGKIISIDFIFVFIYSYATTLKY